VTSPNRESVEIFLQEASEHLQYLREYSGMLQEPHTKPEDLEKLYIAAHTLAGTSASYGFPQFSEVAAKMAHIFHYAMNATLTAEMHGPLTEFISDAISVLEFDLLQISSSGAETVDDITAFKQRYSFAFPAAPSESASASDDGYGSTADGSIPRTDQVAQETVPAISYTDKLPKDGEVPDEVLEFFIPEAEEHLQVVIECLLMLEANSTAEDINRLFRAMHTVKGSAAQVGLHRLSAVAHRVEDLIGELRDGHLQPNADIIDICLQSVDVLKKLLHRQWESDAEMRGAIDPLLARIEELAPEGGDQDPAESSRSAAIREESRKEPVTEPTASAAPSVHRKSCRKRNLSASHSSAWTA
jgi:chemotaxis protein histidine kinase CheA